MRQHFVSLEKQIGPPLQAGNHVIRLEARSLRLTVPGAGSLAWTRPVSVQVQSPSGEERIIPVRDVTRWIELTLWALPALLALTAAIMSIATHRARNRAFRLQGVFYEQAGSIQSTAS